MSFELMKLPYDKNALEPYLSSETIDFHYGKHHNTYVDMLNTLLPDTSMSLEEVILDAAGDDSKMAIFNNAAQIWNHDFYWKSINVPGSDNTGANYNEEVKSLIENNFGSFDNFKNQFETAGKTQFGSGWAWLVEKNGKLEIMKTANAFTPLTDKSVKPLLTMDVWEHAYYIDYRNKRPDYINSFIEKLINWDFVLENLSK